MPIFVTVPDADFDGLDTTFANAIYSNTPNITGLTNGVPVRTAVLSGFSDAYQTAAAPSYSFLGNSIVGGAGHVVTLSADVGAASPKNFILIGVSRGPVQNGADPTVTVGSTTLSKITSFGIEFSMCFYGGFIPAESGIVTMTIDFISGAAFHNKAMSVWLLKDLNSAAPKQIIYGNGTMPVNQQDLVFQITYSGVDTADENNNGATQLPNRSAAFKVGAQVNNTAYSADWVIAADNPAFNFGHVRPFQRLKISFA